LTKDRKVGAIWRAAVDSIDCTMGEAASFEGQVMVYSLKQLRQIIKSSEDKLEDACLEFPEYTYLLSIRDSSRIFPLRFSELSAILSGSRAQSRY
jgi:hypothetical protein